jgi:polar amino acid transport system permease protein
VNFELPRPLDLVPSLLPGLEITVELTIAGACLALVIAFAAGLARLSRHRVVRGVAAMYVEVFRGTSALVQIFYIFYVLPLLGLDLAPVVCAVLALGLNTGAYGSEVVRAAVVNVDRGQWEASTALDFTAAQRMRLVILPQAIVAMLPLFGNLLIELMKLTSLCSLITITDLAFTGKLVMVGQGRVVEVYGLVLVLYFAVSLVLGRFSKWVERRTANALHLGAQR